MSTNPLFDALASADLKILGGCDDCDAYQTMTRDDSGIYHLTVHHDDDCPTLQRMTNR